MYDLMKWVFLRMMTKLDLWLDYQLTYAKLMVVFNVLKGYLMPNASFPAFQKYVLTLIKMRLDLSNAFASYLFNTRPSIVSRIFSNYLHLMYIRLVPQLVKWPERGAKSFITIFIQSRLSQVCMYHWLFWNIYHKA